MVVNDRSALSHTHCLSISCWMLYCERIQLIRRYWHLSRDHTRRRRGLLSVDPTDSREQDSFLEKHGMARDRRPTCDLTNVVQQSQHRSLFCNVFSRQFSIVTRKRSVTQLLISSLLENNIGLKQVRLRFPQTVGLIIDVINVEVKIKKKR